MDFISNGLLKEQYQICSMYYWLWLCQPEEFEKKYFSTQRKTDMLEWFGEYFATQSNRGGEIKPETINTYLVDMMNLADEKPDESVYNIKVFCENADNRVLNLEVFYNEIINNDYFEYPGEKYKGKISKQEMKKMWKQKDFLENVLRERQWYEETYHKTNPERYPQLPPLPIVLKRSKSAVRVTKRWIRNNIRKANSYTHSIR